MKYIEIPQLSQLALALNHDGPECSVHTRIEAYSCKNVKRDKRLFRTLENAYADDVQHSPPAPSFVLDTHADMTPFGPFDKHASRKTLYLLIALLNAAFPDHEFSDVKPAHFTKEQSGAALLRALSAAICAPTVAPRTYSAYPPDFFPRSLPTSSSPPAPARPAHAPPDLLSGTHPTLFRILDDAVRLHECEVFSYAPDIAADPHASEFSDADSDTGSDPESDASPQDEDTFAFDDYDVDEHAWSSSKSRPAPGGRCDGGALLWSSHWFFLNRKLKRVLFVSVWARARRWAEPGPDEDEGIRGERFVGWEGAVGAGARALGLRASV